MYFRPAEWRKDKTIWLAWPFDQDLWGNELPGAQREFLALIQALRDEQLVILFPDRPTLDEAAQRMGAARANHALKVLPYGDIWLRDTMPIFVKDEQGQAAAVIPQFNGWGEKYLFEDDLSLSARVADLLLIKKIPTTLIFEGGAIECDGFGTMLTTEQCLLNKNRNDTWSKESIEAEFNKLFGVTKVIWLKEGLKHDHTDGHIDTIARFVGPQQVAIMVPDNKDDPNYDVMMAIKNQLAGETDARGNPLELVEIPSPVRVEDRSSELMPASYLNFIMGDDIVVVPLYRTANDDRAVEAFQKVFKQTVVGLSAKSILSGGGAFHCISQEFYR